VRDALAHGFAVILLRDAIRAVELEEGDGRKAEEEMIRLGAVPLTIGALAEQAPEAGSATQPVSGGSATGPRLQAATHRHLGFLSRIYTDGGSAEAEPNGVNVSSEQDETLV
jgi:hypothetical protein